MKLNGKVVTVTGAGGGIGRELVIQLLHKGASVAAVDINEESLSRTLKAAGNRKSRVSIHKTDITDRNAVSALPASIVKKHGQVDALINNAGIIQPFKPFSDLEYETMQRIININLFGMMFMTQAFLPFLAERPEAYIANVSSMGGFLPVPGQSLYGATKAGVRLLTEGLRAELAGTKIKVSVIIPGGINTDIIKNSGAKDSIGTIAPSRSPIRLTTPGDAAGIILSGIERNRARILIGIDAAFLDLFSRMAPLRAEKFIGRMMKSLNIETLTDPEKLHSPVPTLDV